MELFGKKVLIIVENLPVPFDRRVWQEANALAASGAQVVIISPKTEQYNKTYELINNIHIYRHALPKEGDCPIGFVFEYLTALFWQFFLSMKILIKHGFDIIHACNPPDLIFLVALPYKIIGKKFIFDHHDINPELYLAKFEKKDLIYNIICFFEKLTFKLADISIATNVSYKNIAIIRGKMKPSKVFIVRSGPRLDSLRLVTKNNLLKKGKEFLIGYVGVIGKQEGINHLLEVIYLLVNKYHITHFHCMICGSGPVLKEMIKISKDLRVEEYVTFTGRIPDSELLEILSTADICVNPDIWNEMNDKSTMNKIMEYMSLGKPIVQYDLCEGKFSAQKSSLYAAPNDRDDFARKIIELMDNPGLREEMGNYGKKRIENELQWKFEEPKLIKAYSFLLNGLNYPAEKINKEALTLGLK